MTGEQRCPTCSALNPASAPWCGQCHRALGGDEPPPQAATGDAALATEAASTDGGTAAQRTGRATAGVDHRFRRQGETLLWTCPRCGTDNDVGAVDDLACAVCGASAIERFATPTRETPAASWTTGLALSAVLPGVGHAATGDVAGGIARCLLFLVWVAGGLVAAFEGGATVAVPLLGGAAILWAGSLLDLLRLRAGAEPVLHARALLWLVVGVLLATAGGLAVTAARISGA